MKDKFSNINNIYNELNNININNNNITLLC